MTEISIPYHYRKNTNILVRGNSRRDCVRLLNQAGFRNISYGYLRDYGLMWGSRVIRPKHDGWGVWTAPEYGDDTTTTPILEIP